MGNILKTAPEDYSKDSANALIKAAAMHMDYAEYKVNSDTLMKSFDVLRNAGAEGITFEQAKEDIHLSGNIANMGEVAARIALDDGLSLYRNANDNVAKHSFSGYNKSKSKKTTYSQYRTLAIGWSKSPGTKVGDIAFLPKNLNSAAIIQATEDGYVELKSGSYKKVRDIYERAYGKATDKIYGNLESLKAEQGRNIWDMQLSGNGRNDDRDSESTGKSKLRGDTAGSFENSGRGYYGSKGKVSIAPGIKVKATDLAILKRIARSGNVAVVIENFSGADKDAKGFYSGGVIHLNAKKLSEGGFTYTGIHESVHFLKDANLEGYKSIEKFIKNYYKEKGVSLKNEIKLTQDFYAQKGQVLTPDEALEEIVCNTLSDISTDADALTAFMGLDKSTQNKLVEALKAIARKLKEWANKCLGNAEYHSTVINDADTLLSLAKQLRDELKKSGQKNNTAEGSGVKYEINDNYSSEVEAWVNEGKPGNETFILGSTGPVLQGLGAIESDIYMLSDKINTILSDHPEMTINEIKKIPRILENPVLILKSRNVGRNAKANTRLVIFGSIKTEGGVPVLSILDLRPNENNFIIDDMQKVTSAYTKDNNPVDFIKNSDIVFADKNKTTKLLKSIGFQTPIELQQSGSIGSISYFKRTVNITGEKFEDVVTVPNKSSHSFASTDEEYVFAVESGDTELAQSLVDEAAEVAFKDSKIRDESGKLLKVYHGTESEDFYEFDKARRGQTDTSMYGRGYYFAFDPDYSSDFGDNIREFYLDIKKPFYIDINAPASKIASFLESKGVKVGFDYSNMKSHYFAKNFGSQKFTDTLVDLGFDGVIVRTDEGDYWETVAFHRNQMKLADAVTYDDGGNVIPISERFGEKKDVRYSFDEGITTGKNNTKRADELTESDFRVILDNVKFGLYKNSTYVPIRATTPEFFIDVVREHSKGEVEVMQVPMASAVEHMRQNMEENDGTSYGNKRPHNLEVDDVVNISKEMGHPSYIVKQRNGRYAMVVSFYNKSHRQVLAVIDFASDKEPIKNFKYKQYMNGYNDGYYNIIVTQYEPDDLKTYLDTNEVVYDKKKMNGKYQVGSGRIVAFTHDIPFINNTIAQTDESVNKKYSFGEEELHYRIHLSEKSERGQYLRNSTRAVGTLLKLTRKATVR